MPSLQFKAYHKKWGSAQYVVIVQYPIEEEKGSVGSSSLHVKHYLKEFAPPGGDSRVKLL